MPDKFRPPPYGGIAIRAQHRKAKVKRQKAKRKVNQHASFIQLIYLKKSFQVLSVFDDDEEKA
jgi:hypothetical protein